MIGSLGETVSNNKISYNQKNFAVIGQFINTSNIRQLAFETTVTNDLVRISEIRKNNSPDQIDKTSRGDKSKEYTSKTKNNTKNNKQSRDYVTMAIMTIPGELFLILRKRGVKKLSVVSVGYRESKLFSRLNKSHGNSLFHICLK